MLMYKLFYILWNILLVIVKNVILLLNLVLPYKLMDMLLMYNLTSDLKIIKIETDFDKVVKFNKLFNVPQTLHSNTKKENIKIITDGFALITEEYKELQDAINDKNKIEVKDALCDLVYVIYGLLYRINFTSNTKLSNIAHHLITRDNIYNSYNLSKIINDYVYLNKIMYINELVHVNDLMAKAQKETIETQFKEISKDMIKFYETIKITDDLKYYINNIETNITTGMYNVNSCINYNMLTASLINLLLQVYQYSLLTIDFDTAFNIVHKSNMSKICSSEEEAKLTVKFYKDRFASGELKYDTPYYNRISNNKWIVRNHSTMKVLKNINYHPVEDYKDW
jgi:predicted HAD superfamily Cof-like phosphohydrolase